MNGLLLNMMEANWRRQPVISISKVKRLHKWLAFAGIIGITGGLIFLAAMFFVFRPVTVSGKVISANTKMPISDVMVAAESAVPYEDSGFGSYVRTDQDGKFVVEARGKSVVISAWKPGYVMNGESYGYAFTLIGREITVELRELTPTNLVTAHDEFYDLKPNEGFSFALGKVVDGNSPDADILIGQATNDKTTVFVESRGEGGVIFQPTDNKINFLDSPEAPLTSYEQRASINLSPYHSQEGFFFVRTRDGKHYAKLGIAISVVMPPKGDAYLAFDMKPRITWAYQPDGTRNLEIAPSKKMPFPFHEFGLSGESLGR